MDLLDRILERENKFLLEIKELHKEGNPIYIYGASLGAKQVADRLSQAGIPFDGMVVDAKYYKGEGKQKNGILCLEDVLHHTERKINLIIAFKGYQQDKSVEFYDKINRIIDRDCWAGNHEVDSSYVTYEWVTIHLKKLQDVYQKLCDEKSKETFVAFLNQKISMDYRYLKKTKSDFQYFEDGIVILSEHEVFVDCGAYNGDSALAFIEALNRKKIVSYDGIISFEPDQKNFDKLCARGLKNHICIQKGLSDANGSVSVLDAGTSSRIVEQVENENAEIELDTIDHALYGRRVTMIKMDVEGFELAALKGAKDTIIKWKPKLAICIYHKKEDLWEIAEYIHQLEPGYQLYMRNYEDSATELVLYAVMQ